MPKIRRAKGRARDRRRGSAHQRGYGVAHRKRRASVLRRYPWCAWPGCPIPASEADHITPKSLGGSDRIENYQGLCRDHHRLKTAIENDWRLDGDSGVGQATIVCGPPASGKSTLVQLNRQPGDVVYDFDRIAEALAQSASYEFDYEHIGPYVEACRTAVIAQWLQRPDHQRGHLWVVVSGWSAGQRRSLRGQLGARVVVLETDGDECLARIQRDARRAHDLAHWRTIVRNWWARYEADEQDTVIETALGQSRELDGLPECGPRPAGGGAPADGREGSTPGGVTKVPARGAGPRHGGPHARAVSKSLGKGDGAKV